MAFLSDPRFRKRLKLYIFGFLMGITLVIVLFEDRFPGAPSIKEVRTSFEKDSLVVSKSVDDRLDSLGWSHKAFKDSLLRGKFVLPKRSEPETKKFHIRPKGHPGMKVHLKVLEDNSTRAERIEWRR